MSFSVPATDPDMLNLANVLRVDAHPAGGVGLGGNVAESLGIERCTVNLSAFNNHVGLFE